MGPSEGSQVGRGVGRLFAEGTLAGLDDEALLDRYAARRDDLAFEAIVARHGPMVLGVCRRVLGDAHAAEDAFQATFLILARKARAVRRGSSLAGWLYRVAHRISVREHAAGRRRREREVLLAMAGSDGVGPPSPSDMPALLDEIDRLPDRYRTPIVLCGIEGLTAEAAAERIGCPVGTVWGRLSRARERLRARLVRRGFALGAGAVALGETSIGEAAVPLGLLEATVRLGASLGTNSIASVASPTVARMTEGGLAMLDRARWTVVAMTLVTGLALAGGALAVGRSRPAKPPRVGPPAVVDEPAGEAVLPDGCEPIYRRTSPDGKRVAYIGRYTPDEGPEQSGLFVVDLAAKRVRRLLPDALKTAPAWSPDSRRLAVGDAPGYVVHYPLILVDSETGAVERTGVEGVGAAWSPDGRSIAVSTEIQGGGSWSGGIPIDGRIALYDVATKVLTPITPPGFNLHDPRSNTSALGGSLRPAWSPDSRRLAFQHQGLQGEGSIWVVDRDGTHLRRAFDGIREARWSPDGRTLIVAADNNHPEAQTEVDRLAVVGPEGFPGPPRDLAATIRSSREVEARAHAFDPAPIFGRNRPWLNPPLDRPRAVSFVHTMAPARLDERFARRADGAMMLAVVRREDAKAAREVGRTWIIGPDRRQFALTAGSTYPKVDLKTEAEVAAFARGHLMGTRINFTALDWARDPAAFAVSDVRPAPDGTTIEVEIAPARRRYRMNAGAMFETTSWSYLHDIDVTRSVLTIDAATHRVVREVDFGPKGKACEVTPSDWLDSGPGESVPLRLRLEFPEHKFVVDDRFAWHPEGLWILKEGSSKFAESEAQRESIVDLKIDAPDPTLDVALGRARDGLAALDATAAPTEPRPVATQPFAPGVRVPLAGNPGGIAALSFTFRGRRPNDLTDHWDSPNLVARLERTGAGKEAEALLVLYGEHARPLGAARVPIPSKEGPFDIEIGLADDFDGARTWSLTVLDGDRATPVLPGVGGEPPQRLLAASARFDDPIVVQVAPTGGDRTSVRAVKLRRDASAAVVAEVEFVGRDHWTERAASATVVLLDDADVPIAGGTIDRKIHVEGEVVPVRAGLGLGRAGREPKWMLVGLRSVLVGMPMGSKWGMMLSRNSAHPVGLLLEGDDSQVWRRGLAALNDEARGSARRVARDRDGARLRQARGDARRAIKPHVGRLASLFPRANDPAGLPLLCRLAGYSGDDRFVEPMRRLLDHPSDDVRDGAAIGLGLLGDASVAPRLRAILDKLPQEKNEAELPMLGIKLDATNALETIEGR